MQNKIDNQEKKNDKPPALKNVHRHYNDSSIYNTHGRKLSLSCGDCSRNIRRRAFCSVERSHFLNRRWYASLAQASKSITSTNANDRRAYGAIFKGKYNPYRIMQTVINCCILICTIFLMISGIILSNQLFTFLNIQSGLGFARIAHLLSSHWYYLFMSLHIGLHVGG